MFKQRVPAGPKIDAQQYLPWIEKYRPKSMEDVACQEDVVAALKKSLETGNLPHLLFYGPPGTGKTSTILAIGRQLYGPDLFKQRVMELNASDERGIAVIRTKVKDFSQVATSAAPSNSKFPCPPYKLIILDEADSMTTDAQAALRRTMETYSKTTRFCLICNYVSRIIDPLTSRCAKFRFKSLNSDSMMERLKYICSEEGITFNKELGDVLAQVSLGDLRKAITYLQSAHSLYGSNTNASSVIEISGNIPNNIVSGLMKAATSNSFEQLHKAVTSVIASGYPAAQVLAQFFDFVVASDTENNVQKAIITEVIAEADKALQDGADEFLQLMSVLSVYMKEICVNM